MQFAVSIGLGIVALVVFAQISFAQTADLGLTKDGIVLIRMNGVLPATGQSMVRAMAADPALKGAALSGDVPFSGNINNTVVQVPGHTSPQRDTAGEHRARFLRLLWHQAFEWARAVDGGT